MIIRGAIGSKTGKNAVLPWFWKINLVAATARRLLDGGSPYYTFWPEKSKIWTIEVKKINSKKWLFYYLKVSNLFIFLQQKIIVTFFVKKFHL